MFSLANIWSRAIVLNGLAEGNKPNHSTILARTSNVVTQYKSQSPFAFNFYHHCVHDSLSSAFMDPGGCGYPESSHAEEDPHSSHCKGDHYLPQAALP